MGIIVAVLKDLYTFIFVYGFGFVDAKKNDVVTDGVVEEFTALLRDTEVGTEQALLSLPTQTDTLIPESTASNEHKAADEVVNDSIDTAFMRPEAVGYAYTPDTLLYALPTRSFDGVIARLRYGTSFQILNTQGKWCSVLWGDVRGWVHLDDVTLSEAALNPKCKENEVYDAEHEVTRKLRALIDDDFNAAPLLMSLQNVEYVTYRLKQKGRIIQWTHERPRIAGTWQRLLKGVLGIHVGVYAKTGSVMEYVHTDNTGHVAYVESVFPDGSIVISEVGYVREGEYTERTLGKDEWRELRPVVIEVA